MTIDWLYQDDEITTVPVIGNDVVLYPGFLSGDESDRYLRVFLDGINWQEETVLMYGRPVKVPRLVAWYGDPGTIYRYSNVDHQPQAWTMELLELKQRVERACTKSFNSVLLNLYRDGNDSVAWHSDDEPELGSSPVIASVSLGAEREFQFKKRSNPAIKHVIRLPHGSLLLMSGRSQQDWLHQLPKRRNLFNPRINLTFRLIRSC